MTETNDTWPAGATWVFQGTVAEDATGGTHVCSLTVTPGAGNEMQLIGGLITVGNTATAQGVKAFVTDGTNRILELAHWPSSTTVLLNYGIPGPAGAQNALTVDTAQQISNILISGTMQLVLQVSTAAISVTQTFAVACRIKGAIPTAVLSDTVGTPALTINTNKVF